MSDWQHVFRYRDGLQPGPDFEEQVFAKIKKKKKRKKIGYGLTAAVAIMLLFSLLQIFRPTMRPAFQSGTPAPTLDKEEIPLQEDLFFSTSDNRTRYTLEPVALQKTRRSGHAAANEI